MSGDGKISPAPNKKKFHPRWDGLAFSLLHTHTRYHKPTKYKYRRTHVTCVGFCGLCICFCGGFVFVCLSCHTFLLPAKSGKSCPLNIYTSRSKMLIHMLEIHRQTYSRQTQHLRLVSDESDQVKSRSRLSTMDKAPPPNLQCSRLIHLSPHNTTC